MAVIPSSPNRNGSVTPSDDKTWRYLSGEYMWRADFLKSTKRDTFEKYSISKVVPVYRIKDDVRGQFFKRFLDTISNMNKFNLGAVSPVKKFYDPYKGKKRDYALFYPPIITLDYISKIKGGFMTPSGRRIALTDTASQWISRWGLEKTEETIIIYCRIGFVVMPDVPSYSALLFTTDDGKVNPVKILIDGLRIQLGRTYKKKQWFNWIDSFYSEHSLPPGCDYHTQSDGGYNRLSIHPL